jgi:uncharacterized membrane protein YjgN (DUF898 family)
LRLPAWPVYRICAVAALCGIVLFGVPVAMMAGAGYGSTRQQHGRTGPLNPIALFALLLFYLSRRLTVAIRTFENLAWNHTTIDGHRFESRLEIGRMFAFMSRTSWRSA